MKGPKNDRSLTNRGFIEFQSEFQAKAFLDHVGKGSKVKLSTGVDVAFKAEVTKINQSRNWALFKAEELIKADTHARGKDVNVSITKREVKVDGVLAFS